MLLPKRIEKRIKQKGEDPKEHLLKRLVSLQFPEDVTILDSENAILVFVDYENFIFKHVRLMNGQLVMVSKILSRNHDYSEDKIALLNKLSLLKKANHRLDYNLNYKCKNGLYTLENEMWNTIDFVENNNLLKENHCAVGMMQITSDTEEDDIYSFTSPITGEKVTESFRVSAGNYYGILNLDGTIRENKLFRGESIAKAEEEIDIINDYESLEAFLKLKKEWCNQMKKRNKEYYQDLIAKKGKECVSPYLDDEIMRIIKLKR